MPYSAQGAVIQMGDGVAAPDEAFTTIGEVISITGMSISHDAVDVSGLSDTAKPYLAAGVYDGGEVTIEVHFDADDTVHDALVDLVLAGTSGNYQICWANFTGTTKDFDPADVNVGADTITENAHALTEGQPLRLTTTIADLPDPLLIDTTYWVIVADVNTILLALTNALAVAATDIDIIDIGAGVHTLNIGSRYDFTGTLTGFTPSGTVGESLRATLTFKASGTVGINQ